MVKRIIPGVIIVILLIILILSIRLQTVHTLDAVLFSDLKRPLNIAHRGGKGLWPENTLYAFDQAAKLAVDVLELDVRSTSDGHIVVIHDETVNRTSNGSGYVEQMTLADLKKLDFAYHYQPVGQDTYLLRGTGITIPTLDEVLTKFPGCYFNIEIKQDSPEFAHRVIASIRQHKMADKALLASFHTDVIKALSEAAPEIALTASKQEVRSLVLLTKLKCAALHHPKAYVYEVPVYNKNIKIVTPTFVKAAHMLGQEVHAWTINDSTEMKRLLAYGVDGIVTDRPDVLKKVLHSWVKLN